jgi:hypothetical protein
MSVRSSRKREEATPPATLLTLLENVAHVGAGDMRNRRMSSERGRNRESHEEGAVPN